MSLEKGRSLNEETNRASHLALNLATSIDSTNLAKTSINIYYASSFFANIKKKFILMQYHFLANMNKS